jgi:uncharacterized membrane protein
VSDAVVTSNAQRAAHIARSTWIALLIVCVAWEAWLAPLRAGGSWMVLKALPLLLLARGVWRFDLRALQWALLLVPFYIAEGAVRLLEPPPVRWCALLEIALGGSFYFTALAYLRPFKRAANAERGKETKP